MIDKEATMRQLSIIVDSMNNQFTTQTPTGNCSAFRQGYGRFVTLDTGDIAGAIACMERNIGFEEFIRKFPLAFAYDTEWIAVSQIEGNTCRLEFAPVSLKPSREYSLILEDTGFLWHNFSGKWMFVYTAKTTYSKERVAAFYFIDYYAEPILPAKYTRMMQYADFMMDTSITLFHEKAVISRGRRIDAIDEPGEKTPSAERLMAYIGENTLKPARSKFKTYSDYNRYLLSWKIQLYSLIEERISRKATFKKLLKDAICEAIGLHYSFELLEGLALRYDTKANTLALKRLRIEVGICSRQANPTLQQYCISNLAAETGNANIWLRALFAILGDRCAHEARCNSRTFAPLLDEAGINMPAMMLGVLFKMQNAGRNHYSTYPGHLCRAVGESLHRGEIEQQMAGCISDASLDIYNRVIVYSLFRKYLLYLPDVDDKKKEGIATLRRAVKTLPTFLSARAQLRDIDFVRR